MDDKLRKNKLKSVLGIMLIGFLSSGLWDFAFKDASLMLGNFFAKSMTIFYEDYIENLYERVGNNSELFNFFPSLVMFITIILLPLIYILYSINFFPRIERRLLENDDALNNKTENNILIKFILFLFKKRFRFYIFILSISIPLSILYLDLLITETTKFSAYKSVERDLEIIRPYVTEQEYYVLRSELRLLNSRTDVNEIYARIDSIGKTNNIILPKRYLIGISFVSD